MNDPKQLFSQLERQALSFSCFLEDFPCEEIRQDFSRLGKFAAFQAFVEALVQRPSEEGFSCLRQELARHSILSNAISSAVEAGEFFSAGWRKISQALARGEPVDLREAQKLHEKKNWQTRLNMEILCCLAGFSSPPASFLHLVDFEERRAFASLENPVGQPSLEEIFEYFYQPTGLNNSSSLGRDRFLEYFDSRHDRLTRFFHGLPGEIQARKARKLEEIEKTRKRLFNQQNDSGALEEENSPMEISQSSTSEDSGDSSDSSTSSESEENSSEEEEEEDDDEEDDEEEEDEDDYEDDEGEPVKILSSPLFPDSSDFSDSPESPGE